MNFVMVGWWKMRPTVEIHIACIQYLFRDGTQKITKIYTNLKKPNQGEYDISVCTIETHSIIQMEVMKNCSWKGLIGITVAGAFELVNVDAELVFLITTQVGVAHEVQGVGVVAWNK